MRFRTADQPSGVVAVGGVEVHAPPAVQGIYRKLPLSATRVMYVRPPCDRAGGGRMVEGVDPGQASEAGRLAQKSAEAFDLAAEAAADPSFKETKLEEAQELAGDSALAAAYTHLQQIIGVIAVALPFVLVIGNRLLSGDELETSISAYYHTSMGDVFVGALAALAVFFLSYNYKPLPGFNLDNKLSTLATVAALGVAFFPTTSDASVATQSEQ